MLELKLVHKMYTIGFSTAVVQRWTPYLVLSFLKSKQRKKEIVTKFTVSIRKIQTDYLREAKLFLVTSVFRMIPWLLITLRGVFISSSNCIKELIKWYISVLLLFLNIFITSHHILVWRSRKGLIFFACAFKVYNIFLYP